MRRIVITLAAVTALLVACEQPVEAPTAEAAPAVAAPPPVMPSDAPPQEELDPTVTAAAGAAASCLDDIGAEASARLVQRCIAVSPATRPPCNAANPCQMIQGEIDRACGMYGPGETKPAECAA